MSEVFSLSDVSVNNGRNGKPLWFIVKGNVYDVTKFASDHPGGDELLIEVGGKDATKAFYEAGHSTDAIRDLKLYKIGTISDQCTQSNANQKKNIPVEDLKLSNEEPSCRKQKKRVKLFFCF